ncbi:hypothetical protein KY285_037820 [Solanum tuberosum]|nr:hypothetical protein KY285_037820 [Solanum tuberosum]
MEAIESQGPVVAPMPPPPAPPAPTPPLTNEKSTSNLSSTVPTATSSSTTPTPPMDTTIPAKNQPVSVSQQPNPNYNSNHKENQVGSSNPSSTMNQDQRVSHPNHINNTLKISSNFDPPQRHINAQQIDQPPTSSNPANNNVNNLKNQTWPPLSVSKPSFASIVSASLAQNAVGKQTVDIKHGTHMGKPAVYFTAQDYFVNLAEDCKRTIVGKFTRGKPSMEEVRKLFVSHVPLKGTVKIAYFDPSHVYIDFTNDEDFYHIYFKPFITLGPYSMKIIRWTPDLVPENETTIAPVWILIHQLPWHLFRGDILSRMVSSTGTAMAPDMATYSKSRGNVAKLKVEIDLLKPKQDQLWVGFNRLDSNVEDGYWLDIEYEGALSYCLYCAMQGHVIKTLVETKRERKLSSLKRSLARRLTMNNGKFLKMLKGMLTKTMMKG